MADKENDAQNNAAPGPAQNNQPVLSKPSGAEGSGGPEIKSETDGAKRFEEQIQSGERAKKVEIEPVQYLRKFLLAAFPTRVDLEEFCNDNDIDIFPDLHPTNTPREIVLQIIFFCRQRGELDRLKQCLARERKILYERFYKDYGREFDSINRAEKVQISPHTQRLNLIEDAQQSLLEKCRQHVLTTETDLNKIRAWFFAKDRDRKQQSFILTIALFENIKRYLAHEVAAEIDQLLFGDSPEKTAPSPLIDDIEFLKETCVTIFPFPEPVRGSIEMQRLRFYRPQPQEGGELALKRVAPKGLDQGILTSNHRQKVLQLLKQSLYSQLPKLCRYLFKLGFAKGSHHAAEKRQYAALGAGELMCLVGFGDVLEDVVRPWAQSESLEANQSAARALAYAIKDYYQEILVELEDWRESNLFELKFSALITYFEIGQTYPEPALTVVRKTLTAKRTFLEFILDEETNILALFSLEIVDNIYQLQPELVIRHLKEWIINSDPKKEIFLRYVAMLCFLQIESLDDILDTDDTAHAIQNLIEILLVLLQGKIELGSINYEVYKHTKGLLEDWTQAAIKARKDEPRVFAGYYKLFQNLYRQYPKEQIKVYLETLQKEPHQISPASRLCPYCQNPLRSEAKFCAKCGKSL